MGIIAQRSNPVADFFGDVNLPAASFGKKEQETEQRVEAVEDEPVGQEPTAPEVRLISAEWKPGLEGFQYLQQCFLEVRAEFLKQTVRTRLRGRLYGRYAGQETDLSQELEGFIDRKTGIARMEIKRLWFIDEHYPKWEEDKSTPCEYIVKGIFHSCGENTIDSPVLEMPPGDIITLRLHIDPAELGDEDVRFVLFTSDDGGGTIAQHRTVRDDRIPGDGHIDLDFRGLVEGHTYSLKMQTGDEEKLLLEDVSYEDLV